MDIMTRFFIVLTGTTVIFSGLYAFSLGIRRWRKPAQYWLTESTESSLDAFLIYVPAEVFWQRLLGLLLPILFLLTFLFSFWTSVGAALVVGVSIFLLKRSLLLRRYRLITNQLPDAIDLLVTAMQAGLSFSAALERSTPQLPAPLRHEWALMIRQLRIGESMHAVLQQFYQRIQTEAVLQLLLTIQLGLQHGAQQVEVLQRLALNLRQQHYAVERVKSLSAQARMQGKVMVLLPLGLFFSLHFIHPENTEILLHTTPGNYLIGLCFVLIGIGQLLVRQILGRAYAR